MNLLEISVCAENYFYQIELAGELDASSSVILDQVLEKAANSRPYHVYIDCQKLTYISSAGLGAIISHLHTYHTNDIGLTLLNVQSTVQNICESIGLHKLVHIEQRSTENRQYNKNPIAYHMSSDGDNT